MDTDEEIVITANLIINNCAKLLLNRMKKKPKKRRWWIISLNESRTRYNGSNMLIDLRKEPSGKFENFCRMSPTDFEYLLNKVGPFICKLDTNMRKAIPTQERLAITLRFLATGDSYQSLSFLFKISPQSICQIVPEVCNALNYVLKDEAKLPTNQKEWKEVAAKFENIWNFPLCVGALDGKHIVIQSPVNSGTEYFNYKRTFSIVLMGLVDAQYCFLFADVGCQGRISDGGVFRNTALYYKIKNDELQLPPDQLLPGINLPIPYLFVADDALPLTNRIQKPFPGAHPKGSTERIFNYRLSRARRVVENAFGIMASVFRVLRAPMLLQPDKVRSVTMTCVLLHNFLRRSRMSRQIYAPMGSFDSENGPLFVPGSWRKDNGSLTSFLPLQKVGRKPAVEASNIRKELAQYFKTSGKIQWQNEFN